MTSPRRLHQPANTRSTEQQSLAPGSQTFEQNLFQMYKANIITLDEALANSDSPTNLSWLINNSEFGASSAGTNTLPSPAGSPEARSNSSKLADDGANFKDFTISLTD